MNINQVSIVEQTIKYNDLEKTYGQKIQSSVNGYQIKILQF